MKRTITAFVGSKLFRFLVSGGSAAATEYTVFALLQWLGVYVVVANSVSFACGLVVSFSLNKLWVFKANGNGVGQFGVYAVLAVINLCISNTLVWVSVEKLSIKPLITKLIVMALIAAWNYVLFSRVVFSRKQSEPLPPA